MAATIPLQQYLTNHPDWAPGWLLTVNGAAMPPDTDWKVESRFGAVVPVVVDGERPYDRPQYSEVPGAQAVVYGVGRDGKTRVGMIAQYRPHADAPGDEARGLPNPPVLFLTVSMGIKEEVMGQLEGGQAAAAREAQEELGASVVRGAILPTAHDPHEPIADRYWITVAELRALVRQGNLVTPRGERAYLGHSTSLAALFMFFCCHEALFLE